MSRPRLFILFIRSELMIKAAAEDFDGFLDDSIDALACSNTAIDWNHVSLNLYISENVRPTIST